MSPAIEIIRAIRDAGGELQVRGSSVKEIRITGPKINPAMTKLLQEWKSQVIEVLEYEARLEKGADLQWEAEQQGEVDTARYKKNERHYEKLLGEYEDKCREPGIAANQPEMEVPA